MTVTSEFKRSLMNIINKLEISIGLPWYSLDDVYIHLNYDGQFHSVLVVVILKKNLIHAYDLAS